MLNSRVNRSASLRNERDHRGLLVALCQPPGAMLTPQARPGTRGNASRPPCQWQRAAFGRFALLLVGKPWNQGDLLHQRSQISTGLGDREVAIRGNVAAHGGGTVRQGWLRPSGRRGKERPRPPRGPGARRRPV